MVENKSTSAKILQVFIYVILAAIAVISLFPIINTVAISFSSKSAAASGKVLFLPINPTLSAYVEILRDQQFFRSFFNSVVRVLVGGSLNVGLTILTAFPLSRGPRQFKKRNIYMWYFIFSMLFSGGLIPSYLLINNLKMLNTIWALVLPGAVPMFNVMVLMNFFRELPHELEEAARIDGATPWVLLFKIFIPLALPSIATISLFSIVAHWNAFFDGIIYINDSIKIPLQTYIQQLIVEVRDQTFMTAEEILRLSEISSRNFNAAKVFVTMVPILCIYPFLQKYFVTGLVMGSVKG